MHNGQVSFHDSHCCFFMRNARLWYSQLLWPIILNLWIFSRKQDGKMSKIHVLQLHKVKPSQYSAADQSHSQGLKWKLSKMKKIQSSKHLHYKWMPIFSFTHSSRGIPVISPSTNFPNHNIYCFHGISWIYSNRNLAQQYNRNYSVIWEWNDPNIEPRIDSMKWYKNEQVKHLEYEVDDVEQKAYDKIDLL